jgi:hypothetical protein
MVKFFTMRLIAGLIAAQVLGLAITVSAGDRTADEARPRVEHHLIAADQIVRHFENVIAEDCPKLDSAAERRAYIDGEIERVVLLVAHLDEAWSEAKRTSDKDVRRAAKAPRAQVGQAQNLVTKLQTCAGDGDASLEPRTVWRRVEQEVPRRRTEIALP